MSAGAQGKENAANIKVGDRILVKHYRAEVEADRATLEWLGKDRALGISTRKTGEGVTVARVLEVQAVMVTGGRRNKRVYNIITTEGVLENNAPIQTMILAPEDAAGIKRAHAEALELDKVYEAYPVAEEAPEAPSFTELAEAAEATLAEADMARDLETPAHFLEVTLPAVAAAQRASRTEREVAALRLEFQGAARWDAGRRIVIRLRLAQLGYPIQEPTRDYEVDRLRARHASTNLPAERDRTVAKLANLGTVVHPEGSPAYEEYRVQLKAALAEWAAGV